MNALITQSTSAIAERTPMVIAAEINSIKTQTRNVILAASVEIGRRLKEAKAMVAHGEWGKWLENSVDYSQRTANNLMRIADEYGVFSNSQALANLPYTQAVALLGVPAEEREEFVQEHDLEQMSTRELQQAIKERNELKEKLERTQEQVTNALNERDTWRSETYELRSRVTSMDQTLGETVSTVNVLREELAKERKRTEEEVKRLTALLDEARAAGASDERLEELEAELKEAWGKVHELQEEASQPITLEPAVVEKVIERVPDEVAQELQRLREQTRRMEEVAAAAQAAQQPQQSAAEIRYRLHFDTLVGTFGNILGDLAELKIDEPGKHLQYSTALQTLITKMSERL